MKQSRTKGTMRLLLVVPLALLFLSEGAYGQVKDLSMMYLKDQTVAPAYEGWWQEEDGTHEFFFGYMNENWQQEIDVPVGPDNYFSFVEPGGVPTYDASVADQGQPTHFFPRRNPFLFTIRVAEDFGEAELVWTLKTNGGTRHAYGSLLIDYVMDAQVISTEVGGDYGSLSDALRSNIPPELRVEGAMHRTVRVGEPLTLVAFANDPDNLPARRLRPLPGSLEALYRPAGAGVVAAVPGLALSWIVYRGPAQEATFSPVQVKTWMDTRPYANSPWSQPFTQVPEPPEDGRWVTQVTFDEPGEYTLRAVARDGALFTYRNVTVTVTLPRV